MASLRSDGYDVYLKYQEENKSSGKGTIKVSWDYPNRW